MVQTGERELSIYVKHHSGYPSNHIRRYVIRPDGFVSVQGPYEGGELITKTLTFSGSKLLINYATSAVGGIVVEVQTPDGKAIEGFGTQDCVELIGDRIAHPVRWKQGDDVSAWAGKPVRLRFVLKDADLYSLQFTDWQ
jgi:hypothetical protein